MKLATRIDGSRDGQLVVVSRDLSSAHLADAIAPTLQRALDDWSFIAPQLEDLYQALNAGRARHAFAFDARQCAAPMPRAYQWIVVDAYPNHARLLASTDGVDPGGAGGASDDFLGPCAEARFGSEDWGIDFGAQVAAIFDDVPAGAGAPACASRLRLLMLANDWRLRRLDADDPDGGARLVQRRPATAFSPVAATPDELGDAWRDGAVHRALIVHWNGRKVGDADAGADLAFGFDALAARAARTRGLRAGTILGCGTVSNRDPSRGWSCLAHKRALEAISGGEPATPYARFGDRVRIEMLDADGASIFGAIDQEVAAQPR